MGAARSRRHHQRRAAGPRGDGREQAGAQERGVGRGVDDHEYVVPVRVGGPTHVVGDARTGAVGRVVGRGDGDAAAQGLVVPVDDEDDYRRRRIRLKAAERSGPDQWGGR